jgi:hypothetical protein
VNVGNVGDCIHKRAMRHAFGLLGRNRDDAGK